MPHYSTQHYTTLRYTTLHYTMLHYSTQHCTTLQYINYITQQLQLQLRYTNYTTLQLQLHLYYNYNYNCATPHYIQQLWVRWPLQPLQPLQKKQLQPPFGPSVDSLRHPCITTTHLSYSVLSLKLPPPPCAVLLLKAYKTYKTFWHETDQSRIHGPKYGTALKTTNTMLVRWTVATIPGPRWTKAKGLWVAQDVNRMCL